MLPKYIQDQLFYGFLFRFEIHVKFTFNMLVLIIVMEMRCELGLQQLNSIFSDGDKVFDRLKEEPCGVSRIESSVVTSIMQVRNQTMPHHFGKVKNNLFGFLLVTGGD